MDDAKRLKLLAPARGQIPVVLDSDTYNEIDDQFAPAYALLSPGRLKVEAVYAAPFVNERARSPAEGMEKSYEQIARVPARLGREPEGLVFHGATEYLPRGEGEKPAASAAAADLLQQVRRR